MTHVGEPSLERRQTGNRPDELLSVGVIEGNGILQEGTVYQFVNLPKDPIWVDGTLVTSQDRLGPRVDLMVRAAGDQARDFTLKLSPFKRNVRYTEKEAEHAPYALNDKPTTHTTAKAASETGTTLRVQNLPLPAAAQNKYTFVATAGEHAKESPAIETMQLFHLLEANTSGVSSISAEALTFVIDMYKSRGILLVPLQQSALKLDRGTRPFLNGQVEQRALWNNIASAYKAAGLPAEKLSHTLPIVRVPAVIHKGPEVTIGGEVKLNFGANKTKQRFKVKGSIAGADSIKYTVSRPLFYHPEIDEIKANSAWFVSATLTISSSQAVTLDSKYFTPVLNESVKGLKYADEIELNLADSGLTGEVRGKLALTVRTLGSLLGGHNKALDFLVFPQYNYSYSVSNNRDESSWVEIADDEDFRLTLVHEIGHALDLAWTKKSRLDQPEKSFSWNGGYHCGTGLQARDLAKISTKPNEVFHKIECCMGPDTSNVKSNNASVAKASLTFCAACEGILRKADRSVGWTRILP